MSQTAEDSYVSCVRAAELLNVSVSSIKRMCDQQLLDFARTSGGHRRISAQSISRWLMLQRASVDTPSQRFLDSAMEMGSTLELLLSQSSDRIAAFLVYLRAEGYETVDILDTLLLRALQHCKQLCENGDAQGYQVHQCAATIRSVLGHLLLTQFSIADAAPVAVGGCVGPANDDLVSSAISVSLSSIGCRTVSMGARISVKDLAEAATHFNAKVVWMNCGSIVEAEELVKMTSRLSSLLGASPLIVLTGCGNLEVSRRQLHCDFTADSMRELNLFVKTRLEPFFPAVPAETKELKAA